MPNIILTQFQNREVQVLRDPQGNLWWVAQEVCAVLGLTYHNVSGVMRRLDDDEKKLIRINNAPGYKKQWCVSEPGLYRLIMQSRKPAAKAFQRWLVHDVLPQLRKTGRYAITPADFQINTERPTQIEHSKQVALLQSSFGGWGDCSRYFRKTTKAITGHTPKQWREIGKVQGLPSRERKRGRYVVRKLNPAGACALSLTDQMVVRDVKEEDAIAIGKESITLFQRMLDLGVIPAELHYSPLEALEERQRL